MLTLSMPLIVIIHLSKPVITTIIIVVSNTEKTSNPDFTNAQCKNARKRHIVVPVVIVVSNNGKTSNPDSVDAQSKNAAERQTTLHHRQTHRRLLVLVHFTQHHIVHFETQSLYLSLMTLSHFMH
jgi:hypothetical protein